MHSLKIIAGGFALLAICLLMGWRASRTDRTAGFARAARLFLPVWLLASAINLWFGMKHGGYSFGEEARVFLVVFAIPAAAAMLIWWRVSRR